MQILLLSEDEFHHYQFFTKGGEQIFKNSGTDYPFCIGVNQFIDSTEDGETKFIYHLIFNRSLTTNEIFALGNLIGFGQGHARAMDDVRAQLKG